MVLPSRYYYDNIEGNLMGITEGNLHRDRLVPAI